ncbi:acetate--CoA ligase [Acetobacter sp. DsW_063]|uniref:acetate--CoA ligase n=1 Tax=Acetobacter sp. DsW_063 TaxID=1514894 RepID=UPI000A36A7A7|nr:acetate--CoA ligase [Acetobacter sp. DsW_063]OUJ14172.1 acetyl-CoA synthetase [Acetobacter sp. DsW_063]
MSVLDNVLSLVSSNLNDLDAEKVERVSALRAQAEGQPDQFWLERARMLEWEKTPTKASNSSFLGDVSIRWFEDGRLNASYNCLDRHLRERGDQAALIWQSEDASHSRVLTYRDLHAEVCRFANALRALGVQRGDRVAIHLPLVVEGVVAMLACARIGAIHVVLFGGFSPEGLGERLVDSGTVVVVTADAGRRGAKRVPHKTAIDAALKHAGTISSVRNVIVVRVTGDDVPMKEGRDLEYAAITEGASTECAPETMAAEDTLFLLYTSGSTGKPKAMLHTTGGYLVWAAYTMDITFAPEPGTTHWCTADIAWITGHTYVVYGPLLNGGTTLIYEGLPSYPQPGRWWDIIDRHNVSGLFTAPTAIRSLMREGDGVPTQYSLKSLRRLGSAGEPISPDAWDWFHQVVGRGECPFIDVWFQTETGGFMLGPVAGAQHLKPGWATTPLPGLKAVLTNEKGELIEGNGEAEGCLCFAGSWPGQARTIWGDHGRFRQTYFSFSEGLYFAGDGARRDADGYYLITGRMDDVINVSGHRIGTAEIEDAVATDHSVAEAAAVGVNHDLKGQGIVVFVVARSDKVRPPSTKLTNVIRERVGPYAAPEKIFLVADLPKTRSGKIVRRLLRKIASGETEALGDLSSLSDPSILPGLIEEVRAQSAQ